MSDQILTSVSLHPVNIALGTTYGFLAIALVARSVVWGSLLSVGIPMILFGATRCAYYLSMGIEQLRDHNNLQAGMTWAAYLTPVGTVVLYIAMLALFFRWNHNIRKVAYESMPASWAGLIGGLIGILAIVFGALEMYFLTVQANSSVAQAPESFATYIVNALVIPYLVIVLYATYGLRYREHTSPYQTQTLLAVAILFTVSRVYELVIKIISTMLRAFMLDILGILLEILPELLILTATTSFNFASFGKNENENQHNEKSPEVEMETYYPATPDPVRHASYMRPHEAVSNYAYDIEKSEMEREGSFDQMPPPEAPFTPRPASQVPVHSSLEEDADYELQSYLSPSYPSPPEPPFTPRPPSQIPIRPSQAQFEPYARQHLSYIPESRSPSLISSSSAGYSPQMGSGSYHQRSASSSSHNPLISYSPQISPSTSAQAYSYAPQLRRPSLPQHQPQVYTPQLSHRLQCVPSSDLHATSQPPSPLPQTTIYAHPQPKRPYSVNPSWTSLSPDLALQPEVEGYAGPTFVPLHSAYAMPVDRINVGWRNTGGVDGSMAYEPGMGGYLV